MVTRSSLKQRMSANKSFTIAVDGMGGDKAPQSIIDGIKDFYTETNNPNLKFLLFIPEKYKKLVKTIEDFTTVFCVEDIVNSEENPLRVLKKGLTTTMGQAIQAVADGKADAVFSGGSTGAYIALCWKILGLLPSINKIAIPARIPCENGLNLILDVGASPVVTEKDLTQFAIMGHAMARIIFEKSYPKLGLLNIGTEEIKGLPQTIAAHKILKTIKSLNYKGFIEPPQIFTKDIDVIICDGYAGNITLKSIKGSEIFFNKLLKGFLTRNFLSKVMSMGALYHVKQLKKSLDWRQYNGAPLLGFSKLAMKSHGDSDAVATKAALQATYSFLQHNIIEQITEELKHSEDLLVIESQS